MFVCPDARAALACAREADEALDRTDRRHGHPGRALVLRRTRPLFFAVEADIHHGDLPPSRCPAAARVRERLTGSRELALSIVSLLASERLPSDRRS